MLIFSNTRVFKNVFLVVCTILTVSLSSCKDKEDNTPEPQPPLAFALLYQASPDAPDMDVLVGSTRINNQAFRYSNASNYLEFTPGDTRFRFNPINASNSYVDSTVTLSENKAYSLFTVGRFENIELLVVEDSLRNPAAGKSLIRFIHVSPDAPAVDIVTTGTNGTTLFSDIAFKGSTEFEEITAGANSFQIRRAGGEEVLLSLTNHTLVAGRIYTILLRGFQTRPEGNTNSLSIQVFQNF